MIILVKVRRGLDKVFISDISLLCFSTLNLSITPHNFFQFEFHKGDVPCHIRNQADEAGLNRSK